MALKKLAAIYNVWDGTEWLEESVKSIQFHVDLIIVVYQSISNFGEEYCPLTEIFRVKSLFPDKEFHTYHYHPNLTMGGTFNETEKRNIGLAIAKQKDCSHFLHLDCDEIYPNFEQAKNQYEQTELEGSVCSIYTYFKNKDWRFDTEDGYYVPFIHKLYSDTKVGNCHYPFYVDPTRTVNATGGVALINTHMHHFSWVRDNIERKCRNSSAKYNLEKGTMLKSYYDPNCGPGFYVKDYEKTLIYKPYEI